MAEREDHYTTIQGEKGAPIKTIAYSQAYDNAGYYSSGSLRKGGSYSLGGSENGGEFTRNANRRRCLVVLCIICVVLLLVAALAVGLYFGVFEKDETTGPATTPSPATAKSYEVTLTLDQQYTAALDDPSSATYIKLKNDIETAMDTMMDNSELGSIFIRSTVTGFSEGSIIPFVKLDFDTSSINQVPLTKALVLQEVKKVLKASPVITQRLDILAELTSVDDLQGIGNKDLDESCTDVTECQDKHVQCIGTPKKCQCLSSHFSKGGFCREKIDYGQTTCTANNQCKTAGALCIAGQCICDSVSHFFKLDACVPKIAINEDGCEHADHCAEDAALCSDMGLCVCPVTHFVDGVGCTLKFDYGERGCNLDSECADEFAICDKKQCLCNQYTWFDGELCAARKGLGQTCDTGDECTSDLICKDRTCDCQSNQYQEANICKTKKLNGEHCIEDIECLVRKSYCDRSAGICTCSAIMYQDGVTCLEKKANGDQCSSNIQCLSSHCAAGFCSCPSNQYLQGGTCVDKKVLGEECSPGNVIQCASTKAECLEHQSAVYKCTCSSSYYDDNGLGLGGTCEDMSKLAVSGLTFSSITTDSFTVSWTIPSNYLDHVSSYTVTWTPSTGQPIVVEKDKSSAVITGLSPGEIYSVTVTSVNARTQWDTSRNFATSKQQVSRPDQPGPFDFDKSELDATDKTIKLVWSPSESPVTNYHVKVLDGDVDLKASATVTTPETTLSFADMKNGYRYNVLITARSQTYDGDKILDSEEYYMQIKTVVQQPDSARNFICASSTETSITVSWEEPMDINGVEWGYEVKMYLQSDPIALLRTYDDYPTQYRNSLEATFTDLLPGESYIFKIYTKNEEYYAAGHLEVVCKTQGQAVTVSTEKTTKEPLTDTTTKEITTKEPDVTTKLSTTKEPDITTKRSTTKEPDVTTKRSTTKEPDVTTKRSTTKEPEVTTQRSTTKEPDITTKSSTTKQPDVTTRTSTTKLPDVTTRTSTTKLPDVTTKTSTTKQPDKTTITSTTREPITDTTTKETMTPSTTVIITTTTPLPTTTAPDETPTVELNGTMTSTATYDPELADPSSNTYKNAASTFKQTVEDEFSASGSEGTVTNIEFLPGSTIMKFDFIVAISAVATPETVADVEVLMDMLVEVATPVLKRVSEKLAEAPNALPVFEELDTIATPKLDVKPDPPCRNKLTMMNYADSEVCVDIKNHILNNPDEDLCDAYRSLLQCIALKYVQDGEECSNWNMMRHHFEQIALKAKLKLNRNQVKHCISGNVFGFKPVATVQMTDKCKDVNLMRHVAHYQPDCRTIYKNMLKPGADVCSGAETLAFCVKQKMESQYGECVTAYDMNNFEKVVFMDHQPDFFKPEYNLKSLKTCEYCLSPNIEHIMVEKCYHTFTFFGQWGWDGADCSILQITMKCIEAHIMTWTSNTYCPIQKVVSVMQQHRDRFYSHFNYVDAFKLGGFMLCLDQPVPNYGPEVTSDLSQNHNYIAYLFVFQYTHWDKIMSGMVEDQCSENLRAVQRVVDHFREEEEIEIDFRSIFSALWEKYYDKNFIDLIKFSEFPGYLCADEFYNTPEGGIQVAVFSEFDIMKSSCIPDIGEDLKSLIMDSFDFACGLFGEAVRCIKREFFWHAEEAELQNIEAALHATRMFEDDSTKHCPSQGAGGFDMEVLCEDFNGLGAQLLVKCGSFLLPTNYHDCSGVDNFASCAPSTGFCDQLKIAQAFTFSQDEIRRLFSIATYCFDENPGGCYDYGLNCTDYGYSGCLMDSACGGLEKCCGNGCFMECTSDLKEIAPKDGMCPLPSAAMACDNYTNACGVDDHCYGPMKCCHDGCRKKCVRVDMENIYSQEDCRRDEVISAAIAICDPYNDFNISCRSFIEFVECVQEELDARSIGPVQCLINNTREDVAERTGEVFGEKAQCRVFRLWVNITDDCQDKSIEDLGSDDGKDYLHNTEPLLDAMMFGLDYKVTEIQVPDSGPFFDNCFVLMGIKIYSKFTLTNLDRFLNYTLEHLEETGQLKKPVGIVNLMYDQPGFDPCTDPPSIRDHMTECLHGFNDTRMMYRYDEFETCSPVHDFAECIGGRMNCNVKDLKTIIDVDKDEILNQLRMHMEMSRLMRAIEAYNFDECEEGEKSPCSNYARISEEIGACTANIKIASSTVSGNPQDNYGITEDICGLFFNVHSCVTNNLRASGSNCSFDHPDIANATFDFVRESILNDYVLPTNNSILVDICKEYTPPCSEKEVFQLSQNECRNPYFHETRDHSMSGADVPANDCSLPDAQMALMDMIMCIRLHAVAKDQEECNMRKIVDVMNHDPLKMNLFPRDTDLSQCVYDQQITYLDGLIQTRNTVCQVPEVLAYFSEQCYKMMITCSEQIQPGHPSLKCSMFYSLTACIVEKTKEMTFNCMIDDVLGMMLPAFSLGIMIPDETDVCLSYDSDEFRSCQYQLYLHQDSFRHCLNALHHHINWPWSTDKCSLFYTSMTCVKDKLLMMPDINCDSDILDETVRNMTLNLLEIEVFTEARSNCSTMDESMFDVFSECKDTPQPGELCMENNYSLVELVLEACGEHTVNSASYAWSDYRFQGIEPDVLMCRFYHELVHCGVNATDTLEHGCTHAQVNAALMSEKDRVLAYFSNDPNMDTTAAAWVTIDPEICQSGSCKGGTAEQRECLAGDILSNLQQNWSDCPTRALDLAWHCVKKELPANCPDHIISSHVGVAMLWLPWDCDVFKDFTPGGDGIPSLCDNATELGIAAGEKCCGSLSYIRTDWEQHQTCNSTAFDELHDCVGKILDQFSHDCYDRDHILRNGIMQIAQKSFVAVPVQECFYSEFLNDGYCPVSDGLVWRPSCEMGSIGCVFDNKCGGGFDKCCFDGCGYSCLPAAIEPATWFIALEFTTEPWDGGFTDIYSSKTSMLMNDYEIYSRLVEVGPIDIIQIYMAQVVTARIRIRYWFYPFSYVQALLAPVDDLNLRSVQFENQNYTNEKPGTCPNKWDIACIAEYEDMCNSDKECYGTNKKCCENSCGRKQCEIADGVTDICSDEEEITAAALTCAQGQLGHNMSHLQPWEVCGGFRRLVDCMHEILQKTWGPSPVCSTDQLRNQTAAHLQQLITMLDNADILDQWRQITDSLKNFDLHICISNNFYDPYPCDNMLLKEKAWRECKMSNYMVVEGAADGRISNQSCSDLNNLTSCVLMKIRAVRAYCSEYDVKKFVFNKTKNEVTKGYLLPDNVYDLHYCYDHMPVCSAIFLLNDYECRRPSFNSMYSTDCRSENFTAEFSRYLTCIRLKALARESEANDCTIRDVLHLIDMDPFNLNVLSANFTDIHDCFGEANIEALEDSLASGDAICSNEQVLSLFAERCSRHGYHSCRWDSVDTTKVFQLDVACVWYYQDMECIRDYLKNMTHIDCQTHHITNADISGFDPPPVIKDHCKYKLNTITNYRECDYNSFSEDLSKCYRGLRGITDVALAFEPARVCPVFAESVRCLKDWTVGCGGSSATEEPELLLQMLSADGHNNRSCDQPIQDYSYYFDVKVCKDEASGDLCVNQPVLRDVTLVSCAPTLLEKIRHFFMFATPVADETGYSVAACRFVDELVRCGLNSTEQLGQICVKEQIQDALASFPGHVKLELSPRVNGYLLEIDPSKCIDPCLRLDEAARKCMRPDLINYFNNFHRFDDDLRCRFYNYMRHCVNENTNGGMCDREIIDNHVNFTILEVTYGSRWSCYVMDQSSLCTDHDTLSYMGMAACYHWEFFQGYRGNGSQDCMAQDKVTSCFSDLIDTYSPGCAEDQKNSTVRKAILVGARRDGYPVEHCIGEKAKQCPYVDMKYRYCYGNETEECIDECGGNEICCHDGCTFKCVNNATEPAEFFIVLSLCNETFHHDLYWDFHSTTVMNLIDNHREKIKEFLYEMHSFEIEGIQEWNGKVALQITVWAFHNPEELLSSNFTSNYTHMECITLVSSEYRGVIDEKPGVCPPMVMGMDRPNSYYNWCQYDNGCSFDHKCCNNPKGYKVCSPPGIEVAPCDDLTNVLDAATKCEVNLLTFVNDLEDYTCRSFINKSQCVLGAINAGRPIFYDCSGESLAQQLLSFLQGQTINAPFDIETCSEYEFSLQYWDIKCIDGKVPEDFEADVVNNKLPVLMEGFEYKYTGASCDSFNINGILYSDKPDWEIQSTFSDIVYNHEQFINDSVYVSLKKKSKDINYCTDTRTLTYLARDCIKTNSYWFDDWQTCSPGQQLGYCVQNLANSLSSSYCDSTKITHRLLRDAATQNKLLKEIRDDFAKSGSSLTHREQQWLDVIERYRDTCKDDYGSEDYPCDSYELKNQIMDACKIQFSTPEFNIDTSRGDFGLSPGNCRYLGNVASCVRNEYSNKKRIQCWDTQNYVYRSILGNYVDAQQLPYYSQYLCTDHQSVCTSQFIDDARHKCPWNTKYGYRKPNCSSEDDSAMVKDFVTCVRMHALAKDEPECTEERIVELIQNDYFKLNVLEKFTDIHMCIPDGWSALPTRASVCTSGVPLTIYESYCTQSNQNQNATWPSQNYTGGVNSTIVNMPNTIHCPTTASGLAEWNVDLGCMLYLSQMSCIKLILTNMSFTCTMDQLINSPIQTTSQLSLPSDHKSVCLNTYQDIYYQSCEKPLMMNFPAMRCNNLLRNTTSLTWKDHPDILCHVFKETLGCYDDHLTKEGTACSPDQLKDFQLRGTAIQQYVQRPAWGCDDPAETTTPFDSCPAELPYGDLCTNKERLGKLVIGVCIGLNTTSWPHFNRTDDLDENVGTCWRLQSMVWCGTNVTMIKGSNCTENQVKDALYQESELVKSIEPDIDINVCQDSCYEWKDAVAKCVTPYMWAWNIDHCRKYYYMWNCLDKEIKKIDGGHCNIDTITSILRLNSYNSYYDCQDPLQHKLDICDNVTEIATLGIGKCSSFSYNMSLNCMNSDEARDCYTNVIDTFGSNCYDKEKLTEEALVIGGKINGHDLSKCLKDKYTNDGFCPPSVNTYTYCGGNINISPDSCKLDVDCGTTEKCCFYGCNSTCKEPKDEPGRYYGYIHLKDAVWKPGMADNTSKDFHDFLEEYNPLIEALFSSFHRYMIEKLSPEGVKMWGYVWSRVNPNNILPGLLNYYYPYPRNIGIEIGYFDRNEEPNPGMCPSYSDINHLCNYNPQECRFDKDCQGTTAKCCYANCNNIGWGNICVDPDEPKDKTCYDYMIENVMYCSLDLTNFINEYDHEKKCSAYKNLTSCLTDGHYCLKTEARDTMNENIHEIARSYGYNDIGMFDPYMCYKDKTCNDHVNEQIIMSCSTEMWNLINEYSELKRCSLLKNLTTCVKHFIGYPCSETDEIANMMGENIQEIARSFIFNETGTSGVDITKWLAPFRCDVWPSCYDMDKIKGDNLNKCWDDMDLFQNANNDFERCRYFESVAECIVQDLQYDNLNCDLEKMKSDMSNVFSEWSGVHSWNYHDYCEGDVDVCWNSIDLSYCSNNITEFINEMETVSKCRRFNDVALCIKYQNTQCKAEEVERYMLAKIHEVGQKYLTYSAGSDQEKSLWLFEPHFCDVLVNEPCPKFPSDMASTCVEECGEYGHKECEDTEICCSGTGTCGSACLPDMTLCGDVDAMMNALQDQGSSCLNGDFKDAVYSSSPAVFCDQFWKGLTCLVNATMPRMYQDQCLARMKQLVFLHSDTILDSLQYILEFQLRFDADPLTCSVTSNICGDYNLVYHIIRHRCDVWMSHLLGPQPDQQQQCLLFEGLHQCVKFFAGYYCYEHDLRNLLENHISSIAFHFHSNALAASPPTSDRHIDHGLLADFHPDKCHDAMTPEPPKIFFTEEKDVYFTPGSFIRLSSLATGNPVPKYKWKKDGAYIIEKDYGSLELNTTDSNTGGLYECFVYNDYGTSYVRFRLQEAKLDEFLYHDSETHIVTAGHALTLRCVPPRSVPEPYIYWVYKTQGGIMPVVNSKRIAQDKEGNLQFLSVDTKDQVEGYYKCVVRNDFLGKEVKGHEHYLIVNTPSELVAWERLWTSPSEMLGLQGQSLSMQCLFGGNPQPAITWYKDGIEISEEDPDKVVQDFGRELAIQELWATDGGLYECKGYIESDSRSEFHSITLRIEAAPYWTEELEDVEANIGDTATFNCLVEGIPAPTIDWYINGLPLEDPSDWRIYNNPRFSQPHHNQIILANVTVVDRMNIQCNASNKHGYVFKDVFLNVRGEPQFSCYDMEQIRDHNWDKCWNESDFMNTFDSDKCWYFDDLVHCIVNDLTYDSLYCDFEDMKRSIASNFQEWSGVYYWNFYDHCDDKPMLSCHDIDQIEMNNLPKCQHIVDNFRHYSGSERCGYFEELAECIVNDLKHDMLYCDVEEMKRSISDKFSEWSYVYNWNYYDDCQVSDGLCMPSFVEKAKTQECALPYSKMIQSMEEKDKCKHFVGFLGCIKFHVLVRNETEHCPIEELEWMVRERTSLGMYSICQYVDYQWYLENGSRVKIHVDLTTNNATITLRAPSFDWAKEWLGFGVSYDDKMARSDVYIIQRKGDYWTAEDRYAPNTMYYYEPALDTAQGGYNNVTSTVGTMEDGTATVHFTRPVNSTDSTDVDIASDRHIHFVRGSRNGDVINKHTSTWISPMHIFHNDPYWDFRIKFPDYRQEICFSVYVQRHLWEYNCLAFDFNALKNLNSQAKCRLVTAMQQCVLKILTDAQLPCTLQNVIDVSNRPELRDGLLDSVDPECELVWESECEKQFFTHSTKAGACFPPIYGWQAVSAQYQYMQGGPDLTETIWSAGGDKPLKCSLFEQTLDCFLNTVDLKDSDGQELTCTPVDLGSALMEVLHIYFQIVSSMMPPHIQLEEITYDQCTGSLSSEMPTGECPADYIIADLMYGICGASLISPGMDMNPCEILNGCLDGLKPSIPMCEHDYLWSSLNQYADKLKFQPGTCDSVKPELSCHNMEQIKMFNLPKCQDEMNRVETSYGSERCRNFEDLVYCIVEDLKPDNLQCDVDEMKINIADVFQTWSYIYDWNYYNDCDVSDGLCTPSFVERAKLWECSLPYNKMEESIEDEDKCRHFVGFLGCIRFHVLLKDETEHCPVEELEQMVRDRTSVGLYRICQSVDYKWYLADGSQVKIHVDLLTKNAEVIVKATNFNQGAEWLGVGVSMDNKMEESDIYMLQYKDDQWTADDRYADSKSTPPLDIDEGGMDNVFDTYGSMEDGTATVHFMRPINTTDERDVNITFHKNIHFARGTYTPSGAFNMHNYQRTTEVNFHNNPYWDFEIKFPKAREDICSASAVIRHLLEYNCLNFDPKVLKDPKDRCRILTTMQHCVLKVLREAQLPCTLQDVIEISNRPEVREGLLDIIDPDCEVQYGYETECEKQFYYNGYDAGACFQPLYSLQSFVGQATYATYLSGISEDDIRNKESAARDGTELKCSLFEQMLDCYLNTAPIEDSNGEGQTCTPAVLAPYLIDALHMYYQILSSFMPTGTPMADELQYDQCLDSISTAIPIMECPPDYEIADLMYGLCGFSFHLVGVDPCQTLQSCIPLLPPGNIGMCDDSYVRTSLTMYDDHLGFDAETCNIVPPKPDCSNIEHDGFFACGDVWSSESYGIMTAACRYLECFKEYAQEHCRDAFSDDEIDRHAKSGYFNKTKINLMECTEASRCMLKIEPEPYSCLHPALNFLPALNSSAFPGANNAISTEEGCGVMSMVSDCLNMTLFDTAPECEQQTTTMLNNYLIDRDILFVLPFQSFMCPGLPDSVVCDARELFTWLKCYEVSSYTCDFTKCASDMLAKFENGQCQYNPAANRNAIYERFTGDVLPECKGLYYSCLQNDCSHVKNSKCVIEKDECHCIDGYVNVDGLCELEDY